MVARAEPPYDRDEAREREDTSMTMTAGARMKLRNLCAIFKIPPSSTDPDPELALGVLTQLYLVPSIKGQSQRNSAVNSIRAPLGESFELSSVFVWKTAVLAQEMQHSPSWFADLERSTEAMVSQHEALGWARVILATAAIGTTATSAASAGAAEGIKGGSTRDVATKVARRLAGQGPVIEETIKRASRAGAGAALRWNAIGAGVSVGATAVWFASGERMREIEAVLIHRHQSGQMTPEQYTRVFGATPAPQAVVPYWKLD